MTYTVSEIAKIVEGSLVLQNTDFQIEQLSIDSRKIQPGDYTLFIAIKGERHNAHHYINNLITNGVKNFIVSEQLVLTNHAVNYITVNDSLAALQKLVLYHRKQFTYPVIAITGSNGKTTVKEWAFHLLKDDFNIVRSPKSYNSQVGVPLSVWQMNHQHNLAIFEAGISMPGEMEKLASILDPTFGIITNIGDAHSENFSTREQKIKEKLQLFKEVDTILYNQDIKDLHSLITLTYPQKKLLTWSKKNKADLSVKKIELQLDQTLLNVVFKEATLIFKIPFTDSASIDNCLTCILFCLNLGISPSVLQKRLSQLSTIAMRMQLIQGKNNVVIINDSYNSDINSLEIALDFLKEQKQTPKKTVILSDILQSGFGEKELYSMVNEMLKKYDIHQFYGIGKALYRNKGIFNTSSVFFESTEEFLLYLKQHPLHDTSILLKGARTFNFELIGRLLEEKIHDTNLNIDLNALVNNLNYYKSLLKPSTKVMAMVKAFSYGTGSFEIANMLEFNRVDYLGVAYSDEGIALREAGIKLPIMVMSPEKNTFDRIIEANLEPEIYNLRSIEAFYKTALSHGLNTYPVHIKLDTGMHRLGFRENELDNLIRFLNQQQLLKVKSAFTHLAASNNETQKNFTHAQISLFKKMVKTLSEGVGYKFITHALNSSGISRYPQYQFDMVRLGIGLYGVSGNSDASSHLQPVASLITHITQIKTLQKGDTIGYDRRGIAYENMKIATIPIGYGDGLDRRFGNGIGWVKIGNKKAKIVGNICMDMTMIDVTGIPTQEGDEVIVFGKEPSIVELANLIGTIPYEILTGISQRVKRIYFQE